jgi:integrase
MPRLRETKSVAGRRANNTGLIRERKDGRFEIRITSGYKSDGKPNAKSYYFKTKAEAEKKAAILAADVLTNGYRNITTQTEIVFESEFREWYDVFKTDDVTDVTNEKNMSIMRLHIFPALGKYDVKDVDTVRIQRFINKMKREKLEGGFGYSSDSSGGYSVDYIKKTKSLLNQFFEYAVEKNFVATNPVKSVKVGSVNKEENTDPDEKGKALRPELRVAIFEAVENHPVLKPILLTFTMQGLRTQELIALKWKHIDFDSKQIQVRQAVKRTAKRDDGGNIVSRGSKLGELKTKSSLRNIAMPQVLLDVLHEWKEYCTKHGIKTDKEAFVFPNTKKSKRNERRSYSSLRSMFQRFVAKHGLKDEGLTLYMFRHTFATMLLEEKVNPKIVSEMMGHANIKTTLDIYSTVFKAVYAEAADTLNGAFIKLNGKEKSAKPCTV